MDRAFHFVSILYFDSISPVLVFGHFGGMIGALSATVSCAPYDFGQRGSPLLSHVAEDPSAFTPCAVLRSRLSIYYTIPTTRSAIDQYSNSLAHTYSILFVTPDRCSPPRRSPSIEIPS